MQCEEMMTPEVEVVGEDDAVLVAADKMRKTNLGFLPVVDKSGRAIGTISDRDIAIRVVAEDLPSSTAVRAVMTPGIIACRTVDNVNYAAELMAQEGISRVIVVDAKERPVGVLSLSDLAMYGEEQTVDVLRRVREKALHRH